MPSLASVASKKSKPPEGEAPDDPDAAKSPKLSSLIDIDINKQECFNDQRKKMIWKIKKKFKFWLLIKILKYYNFFVRVSIKKLFLYSKKLNK